MRKYIQRLRKRPANPDLKELMKIKEEMHGGLLILQEK